MEEMLICQSCSMPLEKTEDHGTNADGTLNNEYCVYCFKDGAFTKEMTLEEAILDAANYAEYMDGATPEQAVAYAREVFPTLSRRKTA
jgi:hypothetical protein